MCRKPYLTTARAWQLKSTFDSRHLVSRFVYLAKFGGGTHVGDLAWIHKGMAWALDTMSTRR